MTNAKVTLPREVAEAIEKLRSITWTDYGMLSAVRNAPENPNAVTVSEWAFGEGSGSPDLLMRALVNGYEVEKTPEEKVREYYDRYNPEYATTLFTEELFTGRRQGVYNTLDLLGIKIEGINA